MANAEASGKSKRAQKAEWDKCHKRAMARWKLVTEAEDGQRKQELEDMKFARARVTDHWEPEVYKDRMGEVEGPDGNTTPQRPTLVVDKLDQPVTSIINEARRSKLAILIKPKGDGANNETAEVLQGLIRTIEVDSNAQACRMWAYDRAVKCGRGYYRIDVDYANDGDLDLDIRYRLIPNQGAVYIDPYAAEPDRRDMRWALITGDYDPEEYSDIFGSEEGAADIRSVDTRSGSKSDLESINDQAKGWLSDKAIRVAEYYEVETKDVTMVLVNDQKFILDPPEGFRLPTGVQPLPPELSNAEPTGARPVTLRRVMLYLMNGQKIFSCTPWNGRFIPIIPVFGKMDNVDGEMSYQGVITKAKDPARLYNAVVSSAVEAAQSMTKSPYVAATGQIEAYRAIWDSSNVRNYPVLPYDPIDVNGTMVPPPGRTNQEPALAGHAMLLQQADGDIKATTGRFDASLGQMNPSDRSGKAIQNLQQQAELGSSHYLDQLASISMFYEGHVLLDLIPSIYDRPGRVIRILGEDEKDERTIMLNMPFQETPNGPQAMPPGQPPGPPPGSMGAPAPPTGQPPMAAPGPPGMAPPNPAQQAAKKIQKYDLSKGQFQVVPSVGPSSQTQREDNLALLQTIIEHAPPEMTAGVLDLYAENMEGPMGRKVAERFRAMNPNIPKDENTDLPPEAQAIINQQQMQMQELQMQLQQAVMAVQTNEAKQKASLQIAQLESQTKMQLAMVTAEGAHGLAQAKAQADIQRERAKITSTEELARFDAAMATAEQKAQHEHEERMEVLKAQLQQQMARLTAQFAAEGDERAEGAAVRKDIRADGLGARTDARAGHLAAEKDERAVQAAAFGDVRKDTMAVGADERKEKMAASSDARADKLASREADRGDQMAARSDARAAMTAEESDKRQAKLAPKPAAPKKKR